MPRTTAEVLTMAVTDEREKQRMSQAEPAKVDSSNMMVWMMAS